MGPALRMHKMQRQLLWRHDVWGRCHDLPMAAHTRRLGDQCPALSLLSPVTYTMNRRASIDQLVSDMMSTASTDCASDVHGT